MENVPEVVGSKNIEHFKKWRLKLEQLGYSNYDEILNGKDYEIPQNRRRCFMVSILGEYNYNFPKKKTLKLRLKDMLEENVDEKYYLSDKIIKFYYENTKKQFEKGNGFKFNPIEIENSIIAKTITTRNGSRMDDNFLIVSKSLKETLKNNELRKYAFIDCYNRKVRKDNLTGCITTRISASNESYITVPSLVNQCDKDSNGMQLDEQPLKRKLCNQLIEQNKVSEYDIIKHSYTTQILNGNKKCVEKSGQMITLTTRGDTIGVVVPYGTYYTWADKKGNLNTQCNRASDENGCALTVACANTGNVFEKSLRIRKLTPKECFRLMGVKDEDYEKAKQNQSEASLYHMAGDSIIVDILMAIFRQLL